MKRHAAGILVAALGAALLYRVFFWNDSPPVDDVSRPLANSSRETEQALSRPTSQNEAIVEWRGNALGMVFRWCPSGTYAMGSPAREPDRKDNEAQVEVTLTTGFWLAKHEVTQRDWRQVMGSTPWAGRAFVKNGPDFAASYVSWSDAVSFCRKLTEEDLKANRLPEGWEYSLPTEAQWEWACRGGTTTRFSFGDDPGHIDDYAWYGGLSTGNARLLQSAHPVGRKKANPWGLNDMHGNVWEWCLDSYQVRHSGGTDPIGISRTQARVIRGGGWNGPALESRAAIRRGSSPGNSFDYVGFRVACVQKRK